MLKTSYLGKSSLHAFCLCRMMRLRRERIILILAAFGAFIYIRFSIRIVARPSALISIIELKGFSIRLIPGRANGGKGEILMG
jgi:hypothetical protein